MNPRTLAVTGTLRISNGPYLTGSDGHHLSAAGGALWAVAGNRMVRVSLRTGKAEKVIDLPGGFSTSMAGSPSGSFLIVSVADSGGRSSLQRRDPVSGALLASDATEGVTAADVGG
jgi:sugar lactone lactonase YvrE